MTTTLRHLAAKPFGLFTKGLDFTRPRWKATRMEAAAWFTLAVCIDLAAQYYVGQLNVITGGVSLLTLALIWILPVRLGAALGAGYVIQALGSVVVVDTVRNAGVPPLAGIGISYLWSILCFCLLIRMALIYARTPKKLLP